MNSHRHVYLAAFTRIHTVVKTARFIIADQTWHMHGHRAWHFPIVRFHQRSHGMMRVVSELLLFEIWLAFHAR